MITSKTPGAYHKQKAVKKGYVFTREQVEQLLSEGKSYGEIASTLGTSVDTVRYRLWKWRRADRLNQP